MSKGLVKPNRSFSPSENPPVMSDVVSTLEESTKASTRKIGLRTRRRWRIEVVSTAKLLGNGSGIRQNNPGPRVRTRIVMEKSYAGISGIRRRYPTQSPERTSAGPKAQPGREQQNKH